MASLDELIEQFQHAIDQIDQTIGAVSAAEDTAEEVQSQFAGLGAEAHASAVASIKDRVESWRSQLHGAADTGKQLIEQTKAAKG